MPVDVFDFDADLLHCVALAEGDRAVFGGLVVDRDRGGEIGPKAAPISSRARLWRRGFS